MYNIKVICTYNTPEVFLETDNVTDGEKSFIRDTIYRQELLDIFELEEYNETELNNAILELYIKIKNCTELKKCMIKISKNYMIDDEKTGLMFLFSYDFMFLTHICICEFLEQGKITDEHIKNLEKTIN